jgi:hypothetical protein
MPASINLELMKQLSIAAIPVDHEPRASVAGRCQERDIRSHETPEKPPPNVTVNPLYFDIDF